jgi:hypothetical protein
MSEWLFEAVGVGGTASPAQYWDFDNGSVRVGPGRVAVTAADPDFELLRVARSAAGDCYPAPFAFAPRDGSALTPPAPHAAVTTGTDNLPSSETSATALQGEPETLAISASAVVHAGYPAFALLYDRTSGDGWRWSQSAGRFVAAAPLPQAFTSLPAPLVATPQGFVALGSEQATAIVTPGSALWQQEQLSPIGAVPLTAPVPFAAGAALLATGLRDKPSLMTWKAERGWHVLRLHGESPKKGASFGRLVPLGERLVGQCDGRVFEISADHKFSWYTPPEKATPVLPPMAVADKVWVLYRSESGSQMWARYGAEGTVEDVVGASPRPLAVCRQGFISDQGVAATPAAVAEGMRLPPGLTALPLAYFADATLFLGIVSEDLWPDALRLKRRRWRVQLLVCLDDGNLRLLGGQYRCDRLDMVGAALCPGGVAVTGLVEGEVLFWRSA